jgi:hypothetical protein
LNCKPKSPHPDSLAEIQTARLEELEQQHAANVSQIAEEWKTEQGRLTAQAEAQKLELGNVIEAVRDREKQKEQLDIQEHQSQFELIRNKNIEEDHQMR